MTWRDIAACRDHFDPELFFPLGHKSDDDCLQIEEAKAVCRGCPAIEMCLKWAIETRADYGVWGGLTEDERRATKRRKQPYEVKRREPALHGTPARAKAHRRDREPLCPQCLEAENAYRWRRKREYARKGKVAPALNMRRLA